MSSLLQGIRNIIFDFGGVLFEIDYNAPARAFAALGLTNYREIHSKAGQTDIFDLHETGKISDDEFFDYFRSFCPAASMEQLRSAWNSILIRPLPEQIEVAGKLRQQGYRTFVLSNTNSVHVREFERMLDVEMGLPNFRSVFEKIYYSNVIGLRKPFPEIFLKVCEWNSLDPAETLFIDDSMQHVDGANAAGLRGVHLSDGTSVAQLFADVLSVQ